MRILLWLLAIGAAGYGIVGTLLYFGQRTLLYFPERERTPPATAGLPRAEEVTLHTPDGEQDIIWHVPPRGENPVVI
jgi:hypothetical protein